MRPGDQLTGGRTVVSVSSQNVAVRSGDGYVEAHPVTEFGDPRRTLASQRITEPDSTPTDDPADRRNPAATTAADAVSYVPVEYHAVDFARMPDGSARRLTYDDSNPYAAHAEIHALLDGKRIGKVHWTPGYGNATVEVDPDHRRQGIGTRLMHEARTRDASAVEQWTPITSAGQALGRRLGLDAIEDTPTDAPAKAPDEAVGTADFQPAGQGDLAPAGVDPKVQANLAALRLLRRIEAEDRPATADEQQVLARFAGWGALPKVFVTGDDTYAPVREELRGLLSPAEYDDAMQNALNSHFTDAGLVEPMWAALTGLGFESGLVLEAGCGTGNFIGFAPAGARLVGVERNEVSGSIARLLYPSAEVRVESFGETPVRPGTYDAVIGNVPFGNYPVRDRVHNPRNQLLIHDHFISKSLAGLKPGGTMAVITSAGTLDKQLSTVRRGWFEQADLLGAVRLPNAAHRAAAGTEVVTDVLVLRRREPDRTPGDDAWVTSVPTRLDDGTERHLNGYFAAHPENILGTTATGQAAMGREVLAVRPLASDGPLGSQLRERLEVIAAAALAEDRGHSPAGTEPPSTQTSTAQTPAQAPATPASRTRSTAGAPAPLSQGPVRSARTLARAKKVGQITHTASEPVPGKRRGSAGSLRHSFTVVDFDGTEVPYVPDGAKTAGRRTKDGHHPSQADELVSLLRMRDLAADLREAERETVENTPEIDELRTELNRCYDTYVADYGPISRMKASQKQVTVKDPEDPNQTEGLVQGDDGEWYSLTYTKPGMGGIRKDPTWWSLTGLEAAYDEFSNTATKAKFFTQRMVGYRELPAKAESPADAVAISREHDGRVDMDRIAGLLGVTLEEATSLTKGLVFTDHRTGDLVPAHLFLSGNVRRKAAELEELAKDDPGKWGEAAAAMRAAVPPDKDVTKISAKLGMVWIPAMDVETFVRDITGNDRATVTHSEEDGWKCSPGNGRSRNPALEGGGSMGAPPGHDWRKPLKAKWGTSRRTTYQLVETALKGQRPQVTDKDSEGVERINRAETEAAGEQMEVIEKEFARWLWRDPDRKQRLHAAYNDKYRSYTDVNYVDSPYSAYPGMSDAIALDPHQNDAVAMAKDSEAVLLHHEVGTGKTFTLASAIMEKRRLGQIHKPVVVVPNHLLEQWVREFTILYPEAELLATDTKGISGPDARRRFVAQAASHDWDAVVMTASSFRLLPLSEETIEDNIQQRLDKLRGEREEALAEGDTKAVKRIGERIEREESSLRELQDRIGGDVGPLDFETAGFDYVVVDEAHEYKNDEVESSVRALAKGKPNLGAVDLRAKLDWLRDRNAELGKRSVALFATGTPISNSTREFYVMIRFLRPDLLAEAGVSEFDDFRKAFLQMEESIEPTVTGRLQVKMREGDGLVNAGELKRIWVQFADEVTAEDVGLERPKLRGGQAEKVLRGVSEHQQAFIRHLNVRREAIKPKFKPEPGEDTVVAIGTDGLTSAVDLRLIPKLKLWEAGIDPDELTDADSKVPLVAEQVLAEWQRTRDMQFTVRRGSSEPAPIRGGLQLVFCDKGVPNSEGKHSFYDALKFALVDGGLKPDEVAFIHDAEGDATKLGKLTERCRTGEIKVLIGSTGKMGTGLNVQNRLSALHHVDGAYRPDQIEQRNGRAIRRGNQFDEVRVLYYPLEGSTEGFQWAHVARKDNFLRAFALADLDATIIGQSESATQSEAAMLKALAANNPLLMDKTQLDLDLRRMQNQADTFDASKEYHANVVAQGTRMITSLTASITALEAAATEVIDTSGEAFRMFATNKYGRLEDRPVIERKHAALTLAESPGLSGDLQYAPLGEGRPFLIGKLGGVRLYAWTYRPGIGKPSYRVGVDDPANTREWAPDLLDLSPAELTPGKIDTGAITRLENLVRSIADRPAALTARVERLRKEVEVSAAEQDTTFEAADELHALKERNRALTELMRLVAADRPSGGAAADATEGPDAAESSAAASSSASDDATRKHAALMKEAETTYNEATEKWRALRDARLDAPGNVKPAEMGAIRTSRRRIKQQMAERAREARGEPAPRPRIHARDASADPVPPTASAPIPNGSQSTARPAIAPPPPPASPPPPGFGGPTGLGWAR